MLFLQLYTGQYSRKYISYIIVLALFLIVIGIILSLNPSLSKFIRKQIWKPFSPLFPSPNKNFIGRNKEIDVLLKWIDFSNETISIINIVGPPGIGKSALAIYVGNEAILGGQAAYYINMAEFPEKKLKQELAVKILSIENHESDMANITFDRLRRWASRRWMNTLILLDNCDDCMRTQLGPFQEAIKDLLEFSDSKIKIITTSREILMHLGNIVTYKVHPLDEKSACILLERKVPHLLNTTVKRAIADLTGEIPLALQIIGALLSVGVNPPSPSQIISSLKRSPIPTLSPISLQRNMQLNASISLSYDYLDKKVQKVGRYLARFPGSFDENAVYSVLSVISASKRSKDYYLNLLHDLVARSLLEVDSSSGRYIYHKLIKSFFLTRSNLTEEKIFSLAFQLFFSKKLTDIAQAYTTLPKWALNNYALEQHNILFFIKSLQYVSCLNNRYYMELMLSFYKALLSGLLNVRFSLRELMKYTKYITDNLESCIEDKSKTFAFPILFKMYINLIIKLSDMFDHNKGRNVGLNEFKKRVDFVEKFKSLPGTVTEYSHFYYHVLQFYPDLLDEEKTKLYNVRILEKVKKINLDCTVKESLTTCEYIHIATAYYSIDDFKNSIVFFEKALTDGKENKILVFKRMTHLVELWHAYRMLNNASGVTRIEKKLLELFGDMKNQTSSQVFNYVSYYILYMTYLTKVNETDKAFGIQERVIDSMEELDKKQVLQESIPIIYDMTKTLILSNEYERIIKLANYGLLCMENESMVFEFEFIGISLVKNKAVYFAGNLTEAAILFEGMIEFLKMKNLTERYSDDYSEVCFYLMQSGNFAYVGECYFYILIANLNELFCALFYIILKTPFDKVVNEEPSVIYEDLPIEVYPPIAQHSKETTLMLVDEMSDLTIRFYDIPVKKFTMNYVNKKLQLALIIFGKSNLARYLLNSLSIFFRILILYAIIKFMASFAYKSYQFIRLFMAISFLVSHLVFLYVFNQ